MKLIVLYGAPASGKMTIGKELSKLTGYGLFHSHLSVNVARSIFQYGTEEYFDYLWQIRFLGIEKACHAGLDGLIITWVHSEPNIYPRGTTLLRLIDKLGIETYFVRVTCPNNVRYQRVGNRDRKHWNKISTIRDLREYDRVRKYPRILGVKHMLVPSDRLIPVDAAFQIMSECGILNIVKNRRPTS